MQPKNHSDLEIIQAQKTPLTKEKIEKALKIKAAKEKLVKNGKIIIK